MSSRVHFGVLAMAMLLGGSVAGAQTRGGGSPMVSMPARVAPMRVATTARGSGVSAVPTATGPQAARQATMIRIAPNGRVISRNGSFANSPDFNDENGVPGLGFDYAHLAAVSGNFPGNPPGFSRGSHHQNRFVTPIFFGGYPFYSDSADYEQEQQQPQIIVIQQPAPAITVQMPSPATQEPSSDTATPAPPPAPVREVGEFVLVRRDGRVLFASVFSVTGTQVNYVTPEGIRRTLSLAELDTVATQEMNEARGTTLQFNN